MLRAPVYATSCEALFGTAAIEDPQLLYSQLRGERPIARIDETGVHLVASWELIDEALQREADFSANLTGVLIREASGEPGVFPFPDVSANHVIATADEPEHRVHRQLVQPPLSATRIRRLEPRIREWTEGALDPFIDAQGGDFVPISELIPARVVAHLLGLPHGDLGLHRRWAMMGGDMLGGDVSADQLRAFGAETARMVKYLGEHLDAVDQASAAPDTAPLLLALARGVEEGVIERAAALGIAIIMFV